MEDKSPEKEQSVTATAEKSPVKDQNEEAPPQVEEEEQKVVYKTPDYDKSAKWYHFFTKPVLHTLYLLEKNFRLQLKNWPVTLAQYFAPFIVVALLFALSLLVELSRPASIPSPKTIPVSYGSINKCTPYVTKKCYTLAWASNNNTFADSVMNEIISHYSLTTDDYKKYDYGHEMMDWIASNPNRTLTAFEFSNYTAAFGIAPTSTLKSQTTTRYTIYFNSTTPDPTVPSDLVDETFQHRMILDNFILWVANGKQGSAPEIEMQPDIKPFPKFATPSSGSTTIFGSTGATFFCLSSMILLVVAMNQLATEKEYRLRFGMNMMGLSTLAYWLSWALTFLINSFITATVTVISGYIFQVFVFLRSDFITLWLLFFIFQNSITTLAFMLSTFVNSGRAALILGFIVLAATFILNLFLAAQDFIYIMYSPDCLDVNSTDVFCIDSWVSALRYVLYLYPPFNFGKMFSDAVQTTQPVFNAEINAFEASTKWFNLETAFKLISIEGTFNVENMPAPAESLLWLLADTFLFLFLGLYFDAIFPKPSGTREHPLFFMFPSWWGINLKKASSVDSVKYHYVRPTEEVNAMEDDQKIEYNKVRDANHPSVVRVFNLKRDFVTNLGLPLISKTVSAVDGLDLQVEKGTCLGLLGHNGAGKTTTISMLIGLIAPTYGDITVNGISVRANLDGVRRQLGVCPQHDILWGDLTPWNHLRLFALLRGLPFKFIRKEIEERLKAVNLYNVRNRPVKTFSGGMKRRLTVAISLIGSPSVILLDEPTTGLDPKSRNSVWDLIQSMKGECVIILTTHSMAEADTLSDRIAIMADGKLRCVGTSMELKAKYGAGYNLTIVANEGKDKELKEFVKERLPEAVLFREDAGSIIYNVMPEFLREIGSFLKVVETVTKANLAEINSEEKGEEVAEVDLSGVDVSKEQFNFLKKIVKDWEISYTTLEQVFHASLPSHDKIAKDDDN